MEGIFSFKTLKKRKASLVFWLVIFMLSVIFFILNELYPIYLDDWAYAFNYMNGEPIKSFRDIFDSQYTHYNEWGGRNVVHSIVQLLLWMGVFFGDLLNTLAYILMVSLIYFIVNKNNRVNIPVFLFINILIWFTLPTISQNILWITGSANYLWGFLIVLFFLYPFISYYYKQDNEYGNLKCILIFLYGIIAGWTNENIVVSIIFFLIGMFILLKIQKKPIPNWMIFGLIGTILGFAVMMASPGNFNRNKMELIAVHKITEVTFSFYFYRFVTVAKLTLVYLLYPLAIYAITLFLFWRKGMARRKKEVLSLSLLFFLASGVATLAMSGSPIFPERTWFGIIILMIIAIMILYSNIDFSSQTMMIANYTVLAVALLAYVVAVSGGYFELKRFRATMDRREQQIEIEIKKGMQDILIVDTLFEEKPLLKKLDLRDWLIYEREGNAKRYGKYYGVNSIRIYDAEEVNKEK